MIKLKEILQPKKKLNEAFSGEDLVRMSGEIFDAVNQLNNEIKRHPEGKKNSKIKKMIKQLYKIESDLSMELEDL